MEIQSTNRFYEDSLSYKEHLGRFFRFNSDVALYAVLKCLWFLIFTLPFVLVLTSQYVYHIVYDSLFVVIEVILSHGFLTFFAMVIEVFILVPVRKLVYFIVKLILKLFFLPEELFS